MGQPYTHTTWVVKPGEEAEFIRRWMDWASWTALQGLTASAKLLRDVDRPNRFLSFGPWEDIEHARRWRSLEGFQERIGRLQEVVVSFEPRTLEQVAET
jgi:heme-degrading monooxygenase HmoA